MTEPAGWRQGRLCRAGSHSVMPLRRLRTVRWSGCVGRDGVTSSRNPSRKYPVLYLLHGIAGHHDEAVVRLEEPEAAVIAHFFGLHRASVRNKGVSET